MIKNNQEAIELSQQSSEMLRTIDEEIHQGDEKVCENISNYATLREEVITKTLTTYDKLYMQMKNVSFKGSELTFGDDEYENIEDSFHKNQPKLKPLHIPDVKSGLFGYSIYGTFAGIVTVVLLLFIGLKIVSPETDPTTIQSPSQLHDVFAFYGNVILPERGDALVGQLALGGAFLVIMLIITLSGYHKRSVTNLSNARQIHEEAQVLHAKKVEQKAQIMSLCEYAQKLDAALHTLRIYLDEYNATLARILHVEGDDFSNYCVTSRKRVEAASQMYKATRTLLSTKVIAVDGNVAQVSRNKLENTLEMLDKRQKEDTQL
jgi:hypothetical protein